MLTLCRNNDRIYSNVKNFGGQTDEKIFCTVAQPDFGFNDISARYGKRSDGLQLQRASYNICQRQSNHSAR